MKLTQIDLRMENNNDKDSLLFNCESSCISELYYSKLKKYYTANIRKINICVSFNLDINEIKKNSYEVVGFKEVYLDINFEKYIKLNRIDKKKMLIDIINEGMISIAKKEGWEIDPLLDAYNCCLAQNLEYKFDIGVPKTSPDKKHKIGFWCNWDIDIFEVFWVLFDRLGNEINRQKIIEKPPYYGEFIYFVKWKWLDANTVLLEDKYKYGKNEKWEIKVI